MAESGEPLTPPGAGAAADRLAPVLRVIYLVFNEGYASSSGPDLHRTDLCTEALRLGRLLRELLPDEPEVAGLLALMLLTEARRPARSTADGALVPLAEQDRTLWDRSLIVEGTALAGTALGHRPLGEYTAQAAVAALHDEAARYEDTDWSRILSLYNRLEEMTDSPVVRLNRSIALAMVDGPDAGLRLLDEMAASGQLAHSHRVPPCGPTSWNRRVTPKAPGWSTPAPPPGRQTSVSATTSPSGPPASAAQALEPAGRCRQSPVEGSITMETLETLSAGKPPQRACSKMMSSSGAT